MAIPLPYDENAFNIAVGQRADLQERLDKLRFKETPTLGGGNKSHGQGGGAMVPSPSNVVVNGPNGVQPLAASSETTKEVDQLRAMIADLDARINDPAKGFPHPKGSPGERAWSMSSADNFVPLEEAARLRLNPHLSQILGMSGSGGAGNKLSRSWNSLFNPNRAFSQYLAAEGAIPDQGAVTMTMGRKGMPLDITNINELFTHGTSTGYITDADLADPAIVRRKLGELAQMVHGHQGRMVSEATGKLGRAMDNFLDTRFKSRAGLGALLTAATAVGGVKLADRYSESQSKKAADAAQKAKAAKDRAKFISDATRKLFGDKSGAGFRAIQQLNGTAPNDAMLSQWDEDVDQLVGIGRGRMFSKLSPDQQRIAANRFKTWEEHKKPALQAMASGAADISDFPDIAEDLHNFGVEYGIDYSKTPYVGAFGGEGGGISGGLMLDMEAAGGPMRRFGFKRGSLDLSDFKKIEEETAGE